MGSQNLTRFAIYTLVLRHQEQQQQQSYSPQQTATAQDFKNAQKSALQKPGVIVALVIGGGMMLALGYVVLRVCCINRRAMKRDAEGG